MYRAQTRKIAHTLNLTQKFTKHSSQPNTKILITYNQT